MPLFRSQRVGDGEGVSAVERTATLEVPFEATANYRKSTPNSNIRQIRGISATCHTPPVPGQHAQAINRRRLGGSLLADHALESAEVFLE
jgi:hypothetical protein